MFGDLISLQETKTTTQEPWSMLLHHNYLHRCDENYQPFISRVEGDGSKYAFHYFANLLRPTIVREPRPSISWSKPCAHGLDVEASPTLHEFEGKECHANCTANRVEFADFLKHIHPNTTSGRCPITMFVPSTVPMEGLGLRVVQMAQSAGRIVSDRKA